MRWELIVLLAGFAMVAAGCLSPKVWLPTLPNDKLLHFAAFGTLALLAGRLTHSPAQAALALLAVFAGGWLIEILQNWVPGRAFCWRDMAANTAGILAAAVCLPLLPA
jgi:VanZ family protein